MKKITYFRAMKEKTGFTFQACEGYLINFYNGSAAVDLVFGKNQYNQWTVTELSTGFLVHNSRFNTRKEAISAITAEYLKKICNEMLKWQFYPDAVERLQKFRVTNQV